MKTLAKFFIVLGMIFKFYLIFPIIIGIISINKINNARSTSDIQIFGILSAIFVSLLGGVFMLCIKDSDLGNDIEYHNHNNTNKDNNFSKKHENIEGQLEMLNKLYDEGFMTKDEYNERRNKLLNEI